jgi:hypothetical protein
MPPIRCNMKWEPISDIGQPIHCSPILEQKHNDILLTFLGCHVQGQKASIVLAVYVRSCRNQNPGYFC